MKINNLNKFYIALGILLIVSCIYKFIGYKSWERYYYFADASAPNTYPVHVRNCYFITADEGDFAVVNTEEVNNFQSVWGWDYYSPNAREKFRTPEKLVIEYASYRDSKFYSDTLKLPKEKILAIFKASEHNNTQIPLSGRNGDVYGLRFAVGIANNGNILLWLHGRNMEKLILKTRIAAREPKGDQTYFESRLPKAIYLKRVFENLPDSVKQSFEQGLDANANYADSPSRYIDRNRDMWK